MYGKKALKSFTNCIACHARAKTCCVTLKCTSFHRSNPCMELIRRQGACTHYRVFIGREVPNVNKELLLIGAKWRLL